MEMIESCLHTNKCADFFSPPLVTFRSHIYFNGTWYRGSIFSCEKASMEVTGSIGSYYNAVSRPDPRDGNRAGRSGKKRKKHPLYQSNRSKTCFLNHFHLSLFFHILHLCLFLHESAQLSHSPDLPSHVSPIIFIFLPLLLSTSISSFMNPHNFRTVLTFPLSFSPLHSPPLGVLRVRQILSYAHYEL